jgi:hypothetical protein
MDISGAARAGSVRYRISAAPVVTRVLVPGMSDLGAGSGTVNLCFPSAALSVTGALRDYSLAADSGNVMHRRFCAVCGTPLFSATEARPHLVFVRAGSLDDPEVAQPAVTIWTSAAPSWACFNERLPKVAAQPAPAA